MFIRFLTPSSGMYIMDLILKATWLKYHAYPNIRWTPSQTSIFRKFTSAEQVQLQGDHPFFWIMNLQKILIFYFGKYGICAVKLNSHAVHTKTRSHWKYQYTKCLMRRCPCSLLFKMHKTEMQDDRHISVSH